MSEVTTVGLEQYIASRSRRKFISIATQAANAKREGTRASPTADGALLNLALSVAYLEASFYTRFLGPGALPPGGVSSNGLPGKAASKGIVFTARDVAIAAAMGVVPDAFSPSLFTLLKQVRDHEAAHVATLLEAIRDLGEAAVKPCGYTFAVTGFSDFLATAKLIESAGVSAYKSVAGRLTDPSLTRVCSAIAALEARHADFLNLVAGGGLSSGSLHRRWTAAFPDLRHHSARSKRSSPGSFCRSLRQSPLYS